MSTIILRAGLAACLAAWTIALTGVSTATAQTENPPTAPQAAASSEEDSAVALPPGVGEAQPEPALADEASGDADPAADGDDEHAGETPAAAASQDAVPESEAEEDAPSEEMTDATDDGAPHTDGNDTMAADDTDIDATDTVRADDIVNDVDATDAVAAEVDRGAADLADDAASGQALSEMPSETPSDTPIGGDASDDSDVEDTSPPSGPESVDVAGPSSDSPVAETPIGDEETLPAEAGTGTETPAPADDVEPIGSNDPQAPASEPSPAATTPAGSPSYEGPAEPPASTALGPTQPAERLRFSFRYQPWRDVLEWFADRAGLSLESETTPTGTFNYVDNREYTPEEALDLLNSVLLTKGYTLVRRERMLLLINLEDGIPPNFVATITEEELDGRGRYELTRVLFQLQRTTPEEVEQEIADMIGPQGAVVALPQSRQILVTETAGQLRAIRTVIERMEDPERMTGGELHLVTLHYVLADEVLPILRQLMNIPDDSNALDDGSFRFAVDPLGMRLWLTGQPAVVERAKEIIAAIDVVDPTLAETGVEEMPQLEVYPIEKADPESVLAVMQTLLAGVRDVRLSLDPKTSALVALGRPPDHATIRATLEQMEGGTTQRVEVIGLTETDPSTAKAMIEKFFNIDPLAETPDPEAPIIEADPLSRRLIVSASEADIVQIRSLLSKMGEVGFGEGSTGSGGMIRTIPLGGASADALLEQIEQVWPTLRPNRIRVVTPSAMIPSLRSSELLESPPSPPDPTQIEPILDSLFGPPPYESEPDATSPGGLPPVEQGRPEGLPPRGEGARPISRPEESAEGDKSAAASRRPIQFAVETHVHMVSQPAAVESPAGAAVAAPPAEVQASGDETGDPADPPTVAAPGASEEAAPIIVSVGPGGLMIASRDTEALDQFEAIVQTLTESGMLSGSNLTVYYLKHATASVVASTLQELLGAGGSGESTDALLDGILGPLLGDGGIAATGTVKITTVPRLNALLVQANAVDQRTIETLLPILDQLDSPEEVAIRSRARPIKLYYRRAEEVLDIVQEVYADRMGGRGGNGRDNDDRRGGPPSPQEMFAMMRAARGGREQGGGQSGSREAEETQTMTLSVDANSNSLIVSAPELLFLEVEAFVREIDELARQSQQVTEVYSLRHTNPELLQQALGVLAGDAVEFGTSSLARGSSGGYSSRTRGASGGTSGRSSFYDQMRQRMEMFRGMQGRGRPSFGGNRPGGR